MGKKLIAENCVESYICTESGKFYIDNNTMILTPGAKDKLRDKGIAIVYGEKPAADLCAIETTAKAWSTPEEAICKVVASCEATDGIEKLILAIADILKNQYGITDPEQMAEVSSQVVNIIKENI